MLTENSKVTDFLVHRKSRREALRGLSAGALGAAALGLMPAATHAGDDHDEDQRGRGAARIIDVLNFALNLEYLEAEYYVYATTGAGIQAQGVEVNGRGDEGGVIIKANPAVPFTSAALRQYAEEIASDELNHVQFLRTVLGKRAVARPTIDLLNSFTAAARAAGIIGPTETFDPFADEVSFLLGAFIFEDVGVTAYKGGARFLKDGGVLEAAAGILAVEAYHAGIIRTLLYQIGGVAIEAAQQISDLRDAVDGEDDRDQGLVLDGQANLVPADGNSIAFSRNFRQVLRIVYLGGKQKGGFFPDGLNGNIR